MRMPLICIIVALCAACASGDDSDEDTHADTKSATSPATFSEQVALGQTLYGAHCASCHGDSGQGTDKAPRVVGLDHGALPLKAPDTRKVRHEDFVTVGDVAQFVVANMPGDDPGSLTQEQYLAILAFDLKANGVTLDKKLDLALANTLTIPR
jgi:cytochrome c